MSHWVKAKSQIKEERFLLRALEEMGIKFQVKDTKISQYGKSETAQIDLDAGTNSCGLAKQEDGTYAFVGDPYHANYNSPMRKFYGRQDQFVHELTTKYSIAKAKTQLEELNFYCAENAEGKVSKDGLIHITFEGF